MFSETQLNDLMSLRSETTPVVSLYLNTALNTHSRPEVRLRLRRLLEQAEAQAAPADLNLIEDFFEMEYDWQSRSVVGFVCQELGLRTFIPFSVPLSDGVYVEPRPHLHPLIELLNHYPPYGVVHVTRDEARFYVIQMGTITNTEYFDGEDTKRHRQGGWAAQRLQRHEDTLADHNLREAAHLADIFFDINHCWRLILAGADETVAQFQEHLSKVLQNKVIGTIPLDMTASEAEVIEKSRSVLRQSKQESALVLLDRLVTMAAKGEEAILGLEPTLQAIQEERVQTLILSEGFSTPGYRCLVCDFVTVEERDSCPYCAGNLRPVVDVVEFAIRHTLRQGGKIETLADSAVLREAGHIGALLRF